MRYTICMKKNPAIRVEFLVSDMKQKYAYVVFFIVLLTAVLFYWGSRIQSDSALQTEQAKISGYAWSSNIGWISMNCPTINSCTYGVSFDVKTGLMNGYAWSSNIGWISFTESDLMQCPVSECKAEFKLANGTMKMTGWARALSPNKSGNSGWDGWIRLDGATYGVTDNGGGIIGGYAWGSDVIGWIDFTGVTYNPSDIQTGLSVSLTADRDTYILTSVNDSFTPVLTAGIKNYYSGEILSYSYTCFDGDSMHPVAPETITIPNTMIGSDGTFVVKESFDLEAKNACSYATVGDKKPTVYVYGNAGRSGNGSVNMYINSFSCNSDNKVLAETNGNSKATWSVRPASGKGSLSNMHWTTSGLSPEIIGNTETFSINNSQISVANPSTIEVRMTSGNYVNTAGKTFVLPELKCSSVTVEKDCHLNFNDITARPKLKIIIKSADSETVNLDFNSASDISCYKHGWSTIAFDENVALPAGTDLGSAKITLAVNNASPDNKGIYHINSSSLSSSNAIPVHFHIDSPVKSGQYTVYIKATFDQGKKLERTSLLPVIILITNLNPNFIER